MVYAIVRVRGSINVRPQIAQTLHLLRLTKTNHCVLVEENDIYRGMLQVVKDYATWGEVTAETVSQLIASRGMLSGDRTITDDYVKSATSFDSIKTLAKAIAEKDIKIGAGARIVGSIFSQGSLSISSQTKIGRTGMIKSAVSRKEIRLGRDVSVFGYILSGKKGRVL